MTQNPFLEQGLDYWTYNQYVTLCDTSDPDAPCVRLLLFGEIRQTFESPGYGTLYVAADAGEIILQAAAAFWEAGPEPEETATPWPTTTRLVPPAPTPRALLATPMGASNLDAIIDEGTLIIGWVGPALLGILIAAFGWAGRAF